MYVVRMEGDSANITGLAAIGEGLNGSEHYMPSILSAPSCVMNNDYALNGPQIYGQMPEEVTNITMGEVDISQFMFEHPISYSLDRSLETYTSTNLWLLQASSATGLNILAYSVYFKVTALSVITVIATGGDIMTDMIPEGFNVGYTFSTSDLEVHTIYFSAAELTLNQFVLSIE